MNDYIPGGGKLPKDLSDDIRQVNEALKAGHLDGVLECGPGTAAALNRVCRALEAGIPSGNQWEYKTLCYRQRYTDQNLNEEGELGWEVVNVHRHYVLFKRRKA